MRESHFLSPPETILSIATAAIRTPDGLRWPYTRQKQYALIFIKGDFHMCSFKFLTFKFDFDIIKIEHRFLSFIVCLFNYNFGASYVLFQYLFLIIPHFSVMRVFFVVTFWGHIIYRCFYHIINCIVAWPLQTHS